jgi:hypothetical protein
MIWKKAPGQTGSLRYLQGDYCMRSLRLILILLTFTTFATSAMIQTPLRNDEYKLELTPLLSRSKLGSTTGWTSR